MYSILLGGECRRDSKLWQGTSRCTLPDSCSCGPTQSTSTNATCTTPTRRHVSVENLMQPASTQTGAPTCRPHMYTGLQPCHDDINMRQQLDLDPASYTTDECRPASISIYTVDSRMAASQRQCWVGAGARERGWGEGSLGGRAPYLSPGPEGAQ